MYAGRRSGVELVPCHVAGLDQTGSCRADEALP